MNKMSLLIHSLRCFYSFFLGTLNGIDFVHTILVFFTFGERKDFHPFLLSPVLRLTLLFVSSWD